MCIDVAQLNLLKCMFSCIEAVLNSHDRVTNGLDWLEHTLEYAVILSKLMSVLPQCVCLHVKLALS